MSVVGEEVNMKTTVTAIARDSPHIAGTHNVRTLHAVKDVGRHILAMHHLHAKVTS